MTTFELQNKPALTTPVSTAIMPVHTLSGGNYTLQKITQANLFARPLPIGSTTPNTGAFTTLTATGNVELGTNSNVANYTLLLKGGGANQSTNPVSKIDFFNNDPSATPSVQASIKAMPVFSGGHGIKLRFETSATGVAPLDKMLEMGTAGGEKRVDIGEDADRVRVLAPILEVNNLDLTPSEGDFDLTLAGSTIAGTPVFTQKVGYYKKIGKSIFGKGYMVCTDLGGAEGHLIIGGFPFNGKAGTVQRAGGNIVYYNGVDLTGFIGFGVLLIGNPMTFRSYKNSTTTSVSTFTHSAVTGNLTLYFDFYYEQA